MSVARNIIKNPKLVPGGGATELTVSAALKQKSSSIEGIEKVNGCLLHLFDHCQVNLRSKVSFRTEAFLLVKIR
jgi:hypothetical protein